MSDIKEKIVEIIKEGISFSPQVGTYVIHGAIDGILTLIESNYIPKEEHEKVLRDTEEAADTRILERQATDVSFAVAHREQEMEQEFDNRLLDFKIELQLQILMEAIRFKLDDQQTDILNNNIIGVFDHKYSHAQKLKEENKRLQGQLIASADRNDSLGQYEKLESQVKELLRLQREICQKLRDAERDGVIDATIGNVYLNAPEPSIEDLNKE